MIALVCWIASRMVASECHIVACDATTATIKTDSKYFMIAPIGVDLSPIVQDPVPECELLHTRECIHKSRLFPQPLAAANDVWGVRYSGDLLPSLPPPWRRNPPANSMVTSGIWVPLQQASRSLGVCV